MSRNSKLIDRSKRATADDRPQRTWQDYFNDPDQVVRRGELANALDIYMKGHVFRFHRPWWSRPYEWLGALFGRKPLDPLAAHRIPDEQQADAPV